MIVPFETMPKTSRIWIYQADRNLSEDEIKRAESNLSKFLDVWAAHGQGLKCSGKIMFDRFLIITVDHLHQAASGCSIDSSVRFVQQLGEDLQINWFNRTDVAFKLDEEIVVENLNGLKNKIQQGIINSQTPTFNNIVENIKEFEENWIVPAENTWIKRFFTN